MKCYLEVLAIVVFLLAYVNGDQLEMVAKLLIELDQQIENSGEQLYYEQDQLQENQVAKEEKFSVVLQDLAKIEQQIKDAIAKANSNRQLRLVMRLRPLLGYVGQIRKNMETLRVRVVTITTLTNLSVSVNDVLDQFGNAMLTNLSTVPVPTRLTITSTTTTSTTPVITTVTESPSTTTMVASPTTARPEVDPAYEMDNANFFKKVLSHTIN